MYRKESDQTMAIGPEQLDLKRLAKIFILNGDLESKLTKELLREILETFTPSDWDNIRHNIQNYTGNRRNLVNLIRNCEIFLGAMNYSVAPSRGQFLTSHFYRLKEAINIAKSVVQSQMDDSDIVTATIDSLKQIFMSIAFSCIEDEYLTDTTWYSSEDYYGNLEWIPFKELTTDYGINIYVSLYDKPSDKFGIHIKGLYVEYMEEHEEKGQIEYQHKHAIITRQNAVKFDGIPDPIQLSELGKEMSDVEIIDGTVFLEAGLLIIAEGYSVDFGPIVSSYLKRPINVVPVKFECGGEKMYAETSFRDLLIKVGLVTTVTDEDNTVRFEVTDTGATLLNLAYGNVIAAVETITYDTNKYHLTAFGNSEAILGETIPSIYVDNTNLLVSVEKDIADADLLKLLYASNELEISIEKGKVIIGKTIDGTRKSYDYTLVKEMLLVEQYGINLGDKYFSKYRHQKDYKQWIPTALIGNYYISPEPIDSDLRLYKENPKITQVVGILDPETKILYTRIPEILDPDKDIHGKYTGLVRSKEEEEYPSNQYQLKAMELGYYNGHLFCDPEAIFSGEDGIARYKSLIKYIGHMDAFKDKDLPETVEGEEGDYHLIIKSKFNPIYINTHETNTYYWQGDARDIIYLPDSKDECLTYLSISGFKSNPSE